MKRLGLALLALCLAACSRQPLRIGTEEEDMKLVAARAEASYENKDWAGAANDYGTLVKVMPQDTNFWFRYANALARADRPDQAVAAYREVLVRDARYAKAWFNMGIVQLRQAASSFSRMDSNVAADEPLRAQGQQVYAALMGILGEDDASPTTTTGGAATGAAIDDGAPTSP
ncbi:MAG: tetratricopeptide repeat protein [Gammaproteobacteria bacterium]